MTSKDRLKEFLSFNKIGRNRFEEKIGVAYGYMSSKSKTITSDVIEKLSKEYPMINLIWLITGEGEMVNVSEKESSGVNIDMSFSERLKICMSTNSITSYYIGKNSSVSRQSVENYLLEKQVPSIQSATIIADCIGISVDWLLTGTGEMMKTTEEHTSDINNNEMDNSTLIEVINNQNKLIERLEKENAELRTQSGIKEKVTA